MGKGNILIFSRKQKRNPESDFEKVARQHWPRLIKKVYAVDPLVCPNCSGRMRIISFIEDPAIIQRILTHLGLWHVPSRGLRDHS